MVVTKIITTQKEFGVEGEGYNPTGKFLDEQGKETRPDNELTLLLKAGALCNESVLNFNSEKKVWEIVGDITEGAIVVCAEKAGLDHKELRASHARVFEIPFSSEFKFMVTANKIPGSDSVLVCMKGAPEIVLSFCGLADERKNYYQSAVDKLASSALRSIGVAVKEMELTKLDELKRNNKNLAIYSDLNFCGIVAQKDPLRPEVKEAVQTAKAAGVTTIMITGDHKLTATAIAIELGLISDGSLVLSGEDLLKLSQAELENKVGKIKVFARVSPEQKLKIVKAFKKQNAVVAVTGDGVNDA
ncbi:HAD family hydrolase, partial [candidate division WWE3 bacterium]|nr:HAD family hydrolase [candidate division WWE3 bacterium]